MNFSVKYYLLVFTSITVAWLIRINNKKVVTHFCINRTNIIYYWRDNILIIHTYLLHLLKLNIIKHNETTY